MNKTLNNKGFSSILVIVAVVAVAGVFGLYVLNMINTSKVPDVLITPSETVSEKMSTSEETLTFEPLEEDSYTPSEIDNSAVAELDALIVELDNDTTLDDDLEDLNF